MKPAYSFVRFGQIRPAGWMREQMCNDLRNGFIGHLDELVPDLIQQDDIYGRDRRTRHSRIRDLGLVEVDPISPAQYQWWNSETQSNWLDGLVRTAALVQDEAYLEKARVRIDRLLSGQDTDGYLGIYDREQRFQFETENGELWAQATLFRALLAFYEYTEDERYLQAVIRAVDVIMTAYPIGQCEPFRASGRNCCGVGHGLAITDIFHELHRITGNQAYIDYSVWLYEDYCKHELSENDIQLQHLLDADYRFKGHGVHTYEHLRALITACYAVPANKYEQALQAYLAKLECCLSPSGGPIGDEWIAHSADASLTGYEYCSMQELLHSYALLLQKSGNMEWADRIEWLLFNAGQGARHPEESSIAYLKSDNSYAMEGVFHAEQPHCHAKIQTRYKYSPTHRDVAVCCVPNAGRILPYYIQSMWLASDTGFVKTLYGAGSFAGEWKGVRVCIDETSQYPFGSKLVYSVRLSEPASFDIAFRKPSWCGRFQVSCRQAEIREQEGLVIVHKLWSREETVEIDFDYELRVNHDLKGDVYLSCGPLVMALPIDSMERKVKEHPLAGFHDLHYSPKGTLPQHLAMPLRRIGSFTRVSDTETPELWRKGLAIQGKLMNQHSLELEDAIFVPMGGTILRKVTFEPDGAEEGGR